MNNRTIKVLVVIVIIGAISNLEIEVPDEYRGIREITGEIERCDFKKLARSGEFVGIKLKNVDEPYLRANPDQKEMSHYVLLCKLKEHVHVTYHATERLVGPLSFWIDTIAVPAVSFSPALKKQDAKELQNVLTGSTVQVDVSKLPALIPNATSLISPCDTSNCLPRTSP